MDLNDLFNNPPPPEQPEVLGRNVQTRKKVFKDSIDSETVGWEEVNEITQDETGTTFTSHYYTDPSGMS